MSFSRTLLALFIAAAASAVVAQAQNLNGAAVLSNTDLNSYGSNQSPNMATDGTNWVATWWSEQMSGWSVQIARSTDHGLTWALVTNGNNGEHPLFLGGVQPTGWPDQPAIASAGGGVFIIVYGRHASSLPQLFASKSTDGGVTWSAPTQLTSTASPVRNELPQLAYGLDKVGGSSGRWTLSWIVRSDPTTNAVDVHVAQLLDSPSLALSGEQSLTATGFDDHTHHYPTITTDHLGRWLLTWSAYKLSDPHADVIKYAWSEDLTVGWTTSTVDGYTSPCMGGPTLRVPVSATDGTVWGVFWEQYQATTLWPPTTFSFAGCGTLAAVPAGRTVGEVSTGKWIRLNNTPYDMPGFGGIVRLVILRGQSDSMAGTITWEGSSSFVYPSVNPGTTSETGASRGDSYGVTLANGGGYWVAVWSSTDSLQLGTPASTHNGAMLVTSTPRCLDGGLDAGEACDDGNTTNGDGCDNNCTVTACGNGIATSPEACDDGNGTNGDGCDTDCSISCGNGVLSPPEVCDDSNVVDGDGCDSNCTVTACGNGVTTSPEECDDGNVVDGDACDADCTLPPTVTPTVTRTSTPTRTPTITRTHTPTRTPTITRTETPTRTPSRTGTFTPTQTPTITDTTTPTETPTETISPTPTVTPTETAVGCGNSSPDPGEDCDDGAFNNGDGCDADCSFSGCGNGQSSPGHRFDCDSSGCTDICDADWSAFQGFELEGDVIAMAVSGNDLYVGGEFHMDSNGAESIAKWSGGTWSALGAGLEANVNAIAVSGNIVYAGGSFTSSGGNQALFLAKWDGNTWSELGTGPDSHVYALQVLGSDLYVGGTFDSAGGIETNYIAKWDGSAWSTLGSGVTDSVFALAAIGNDLYVGGIFTDAGGVPALNVAKWNGTTWSALGSGLPNVVRALKADGQTLYATGDGFVAKWNGTTWTTLATLGVDEAGTALAVRGGNLYLTGGFTTINGNVVNNIAKWDGTAWSALGSGIEASAESLAILGPNLLVGGGFGGAGGKEISALVKFALDSACGEQCDDGNAVNGDGCDQGCILSACGNGILAGAEVCDDGNLRDGDGCDSNCTPTGCPNGIATSSNGEMCDDGNMVGDDGCESDCRISTVEDNAAPFEEVSTDPLHLGATAAFPVQTSVTSPDGGMISIAPPTMPMQPDGIQVVGIQLQIEAPPTTFDNPIVIVLTVDSSVIPADVGIEDLEVVRNGVSMVNCDNSGDAVPDPCVQSRVVDGDDVKLTILTSHASLWGVGVAGLSKGEQKCLNGLAGAGAKLAKTQTGIGLKCLKAAASGEEGDATGCLTADVKGKIAGAMLKTVAVADDKCSPAPRFGLTLPSSINAAAQQAALDLIGDVFGSDLTGAVAMSSPAADCQAAVLKSVAKIFETKSKLYLGCKKSGLKGKTSLIVSASQLSSCFDLLTADAGGKIASAVTKLGEHLTGKCSGVTLSSALPGSCGAAIDVKSCLDAKVECRICRMMNSIDGLTQNCDLFDDGGTNGTCP